MDRADPFLEAEAALPHSAPAHPLGLAAISRVEAMIPAAAVIAPTVGLSALLLFVLEPLVGRLTLPLFGGAPGVWATILAFFQGVLLLGYLYGHLSVTRLGLRRGAVLHLGLAGCALVALLLGPSRLEPLRDPSIPPVLDLLLLLVATVGLPAFVLTATTPLLSAWYAELSGTREAAADPYWLYALSNGGSFVALLAYPFLIEPALGLAAQRAAWIVAFAVLGLTLAAPATLVWVRDRGAPRRPRGSADGVETIVRPIPDDRPIDRRRRLRWLLLAAVPAGLLSAVTNVIATDLISAPLLWVGPLSIYLLTFVVAFSARGRRVVPAAVALAPAAVTLLWVPFGSAAGWPILPLLLLEYAGLAVVATALHGRLALDRPTPARLTEFYLVLAAGGVLGGSFVAILAPIAFKGVWEYPILLVGALVALAWQLGPPAGLSAREGFADRPGAGRPFVARPRRFDLRPFLSGAPARFGPYLAVAALLGIALAAERSIGLEAGLRWLLVGGLVLLVGGRPAFLAMATALVLTLSTFVLPRDIVLQDRSFFGVTQVLRPAGGDVVQLMNGTTLHGMQWADPARRRRPTSYYAESGPAGDVFTIMHSGAPGGRSVGIVGLGAGALAAYARPGDAFSFYEIDPVVIRVASDPRYFTYLADAAVRPAIVLGDARLSLREVASASHDLLVLDAFSSDAIPVHLLTVEAFDEYACVLRPGGLLAVHVSNRYYDLAPAVAGAAGRVGLTTLVRSYVPTAADQAAGASPSIWVIAAADRATLAPFAARGWVNVVPAVPLTDDHSDLLRFLRAW